MAEALTAALVYIAVYGFRPAASCYVGKVLKVVPEVSLVQT